MKKIRTSGIDGFELLIFQDRIPYMRIGNGSKTIIIFPPTGDLISSLLTNPKKQYIRYRHMIPKESTLYVLGYDKNLSKDHTAESIAADFAALIKKKIGPGIIVGISYGGTAAIPFAALYPELTLKLILLVSAHKLSDSGIRISENLIELASENRFYAIEKTFTKIYKNLFWKTLISILTWKNRKKEYLLYNSPESFVNAYTQMISANLTRKKYLPRIDAPTLVLGGTDDPFFSEEIYRETAELIPNGELESFKDGGHYIAVERMKKVKSKMMEFINRI
ncbi:MAG: alpha/beta fold hydrolase [Promethearchaeota archaeon]